MNIKNDFIRLDLSLLQKTWILDLDGTLVEHNGYRQGSDTFLPGAKDFLNRIPIDDMIIILTSRKNEYEYMTTEFLKENNIRFDYILFNIPLGERIIINDIKPHGLKTAISINVERDSPIKIKMAIDENI